jgi:hypothetical protein
MRRKRCRCRLLPETDCHSRRLPRSPSRALGHCRAARALGHETCEAGTPVITWAAGKSAVDDDPDALKRDARSAMLVDRTSLRLPAGGEARALR